MAKRSHMTRKPTDWNALHEMAALPVRKNLAPGKKGKRTGHIFSGEIPVQVEVDDCTSEEREKLDRWDSLMSGIQQRSKERREKDAEARKNAEYDSWDSGKVAEAAKKAKAEAAEKAKAEAAEKARAEVSNKPVVSGGAPQSPEGQNPIPVRDARPQVKADVGFHKRTGRGDAPAMRAAGMDLNPSSEYEKTVRNKFISHNSSVAQMKMDDEIKQLQRERAEKRSKYIDEQLDRFHKIGDDRRYESRSFRNQKGWDNLARDGDARGDQINGYADRMKTLLARAGQLTEAFQNGDYTGRGKEFAAVMKAVNKSHENGGLSEAQMEALEKKMDGMRDGLNKRASAANETNKYYANREERRRRAAIGDSDGLLSSAEVNRLYGENQAKIVRSALGGIIGRDKAEKALASLGMMYPGAGGTAPGSSDEKLNEIMAGNAKMKELLSQNGVDFKKLAGLAAQSGAYKDLLGKYRNEMDPTKKMEAMDNLAIAYMRDNIDLKADGSNKAAYDTISGMINPNADAPADNKMLEWRDQKKETGVAIPAKTQPTGSASGTNSVIPPASSRSGSVSSGKGGTVTRAGKGGTVTRAGKGGTVTRDVADSLLGHAAEYTLQTPRAGGGGTVTRDVAGSLGHAAEYTRQTPRVDDVTREINEGRASYGRPAIGSGVDVDPAAIPPKTASIDTTPTDVVTYREGVLPAPPDPNSAAGRVRSFNKNFDERLNRDLQRILK